MAKIYNFIKRCLFREGIKVFEIKAGPMRGLKMLIDPMAKTQRILGLDEYEIQRDFKRNAEWADLLIDVGASDGFYSLFFRKYNAHARIVEIDANPSFLQTRRTNYLLNFEANLPTSIVKFAASEESQDENSCLLSRDVATKGQKVLLKVDVDGWEVEVLRSALSAFGSAEFRCIIETHSAELERQCVELLSSNGFVVKIIPNAWWRTFVPERRPLALNRWLAAEPL